MVLYVLKSSFEVSTDIHGSIGNLEELDLNGINAHPVTLFLSWKLLLQLQIDKSNGSKYSGRKHSPFRDPRCRRNRRLLSILLQVGVARNAQRSQYRSIRVLRDYQSQGSGGTADVYLKLPHLKHHKPDIYDFLNRAKEQMYSRSWNGALDALHRNIQSCPEIRIQAYLLRSQLHHIMGSCLEEAGHLRELEHLLKVEKTHLARDKSKCVRVEARKKVKSLEKKLKQKKFALEAVKRWKSNGVDLRAKGNAKQAWIEFTKILDRIVALSLI